MTSAAEFARAAGRAGLLPDPEAALTAFLEAGHHPDDAERFRRQAVARGELTEFQSQLVARGHDGFRVAGYTLLDRVGRGANGTVYRARHPLGQIVAVKVLTAARARDGLARARFDREAELLAQCDHPHVVRGFQCGQAAGLSYLVMEYLPGETLESVVARRGPLMFDEAARLLCMALAGVAHLAGRNIVHRDLKPANLMVVRPDPKTRARLNGDTTRDATLKLLDVGLGRVDSPGRLAAGGPLTGEGTLLGTPDYLAPEQARDPRNADTRADIYSLGCVLYYLACGKPPHAATTVIAQIVNHASHPAPALPDAPPALQAVYARMTAKRPEDRYATAAECAEALAPFLPGGKGVVAPDPGDTGVIVLPEFREWLTVQAPGAVPGPTEVHSELDLHATGGPADSADRTPRRGPTWRDVAVLALGVALGVAAGLAAAWGRR